MELKIIKLLYLFNLARPNFVFNHLIFSIIHSNSLFSYLNSLFHFLAVDFFDLFFDFLSQILFLILFLILINFKYPNQ